MGQAFQLGCPQIESQIAGVVILEPYSTGYQRKANMALDNVNHYQRMMDSFPDSPMYNYYKRQYQYAINDYNYNQAKANEYIIDALKEP